MEIFPLSPHNKQNVTQNTVSLWGQTWFLAFARAPRAWVAPSPLPAARKVSMPFTVTKRPTDPSSLGQSQLLPVGAAVPSLMQLSALISAITAPQTIISEGIPTVSKLAIKKKKKKKIYCGICRAAGGVRIKARALKAGKGEEMSAQADRRGKKGGILHNGEPVNHRLKFNLATHQSSCWVSKLRASWDCFSRGHSSPRNLHFPAPVYLLWY